MRIEQVSPDKIRLAWPFVKPAIEKLLERFPDEWIPENLFADLVHSPPKATLFVLTEEVIQGFFVIEICTDRHSQKRSLNVWVLCAEQVAEIHQAEIIAKLDELARLCHCSRITYGTARMGWAKAMKGVFETKSIILERKVP